MAWKVFTGRFAVTTRQRIFASALIYGLTLTIRLTTSAGKEEETPAQTAQSFHAPSSIAMKDSRLTLRDQPLDFAQPIAFQRDWPLTSRACVAEFERSTQMSSVLDCSEPKSPTSPFASSHPR